MSPLNLQHSNKTAALSHELIDAAAELACRIEHGEFDDLDEMQMGDLRALASMMASWAARAQVLEQGPTDHAAPAGTATMPPQPLPRIGSVYRN